MALSNGTTFELRAAGSGSSDNNGGGWNGGGSSPGTEWSNQDSPHVVIDGVTISAVVTATTTIITLTGYTVATTDNRNLLQITGGTATAGTYEISAVNTGANQWTLDRSAGTNTQTVVGNMGGALATAGKMAAVTAGLSGITVHQKSGTYTMVTNGGNVAGGFISWSNSASGTTNRWIGYGTTRGDGGTKPVWIQGGGISNFTFFTTGTANHIENVTFDGNNAATSRGISFASTLSRAINCKFINFKNNGVQAAAATNWCINCEASGCGTTAGAFLSVSCFGCTAHDNTVSGFVGSQNGTSWTNCVAANNTGASSDGFNAGAACTASNCTAYTNGRDGFRWTLGNTMRHIINGLSYGNTSNDFNSTAQEDYGVLLVNCAGVNFGSNIPSGARVSCVTLSGDPFVAAASNNFTLDSTSGEGSAVRAVASPGTFPGFAATISYDDIGAVQHRDPPARGLVSRGISSLGRL